MALSVPTWKEYLKGHPELLETKDAMFKVTRILKGTKYPSWTFLTNEFALSLRVPEGFEKAIRDHAKSKTWVIFAVHALLGKPILGVRLYTNSPNEATLPWDTVTDFPKWVALDSVNSNEQSNDDDENSNELEPALDNRSIELFMKGQRSLSRQRASKSPGTPA